MTDIGAKGAAQLATSVRSHSWDAVIMVAIAGAESSWRSDAISPTDDYGVWQINKAAHPDLFRQYTWWRPEDNVLMAFHVWNSQHYHAWTTYTSGAYLRFMSQAQYAVDHYGDTNFDGGSAPPPSSPPAGSDQDAGPEMYQFNRYMAAAASAADFWGNHIKLLT